MCIGTTRKRNLAQRLAALALGRRNRLLAQREREREREREHVQVSNHNKHSRHPRFRL